jgi:FkbM family methyltransferase
VQAGCGVTVVLRFFSMRLKRLVRAVFHSVGLEVTRFTPPPPSAEAQLFTALLQLKHQPTDGEARRFLNFCANHLYQSRAQLLQDLFVQYRLGEKREGFFVEFGATDGRTINNTYALELVWGWTGILVEPARAWHQALRANRPRCAMDERCVWHVTGERLAFNEVTTDPEFSTISSYSGGDFHRALRGERESYQVETVSLNDLLTQHGAPRRIDYLSIDTEGSELAILQAFAFDAWDIGIITVEHNYTAARDALHALLTAQGYWRWFTEFSDFDDWYAR